MISCTRRDALALLSVYGEAVHIDAVELYSEDFFAELQPRFYRSDKAVAAFYVCDYDEKRQAFLNIHQCALDCDPFTELDAAKAAVKADTAAEYSGNITLHVVGGLAPAINALYGWRKLERHGEPYTDMNIRPLDDSDEDDVSALCDTDAADDRFARNESDNLREYKAMLTQPDFSVLGIYEGASLAGMVSVRTLKSDRWAQICDLFVARKYRRRGYGKRIVRAALSLFPDRDYYYQVAKGNSASFGLACSCGFEFAGASLWK